MDFNQGDIVLINFPFSDLSGFKLRPALVVSGIGVNNTPDLVCVQITSKTYPGSLFIPIAHTDVTPPLRLSSGIRIHKFFTVEQYSVVRKIGKMEKRLLNSVLAAIQAEVLSH